MQEIERLMTDCAEDPELQARFDAVGADLERAVDIARCLGYRVTVAQVEEYVVTVRGVHFRETPSNELDDAQLDAVTGAGRTGSKFF
jgi:hypothetical protein